MRPRIARWLDRLLSRACWPSLWDWGERRNELTLRDAVRTNPSCIRDVERNGICWCGKNRTHRAARFAPPRHIGGDDHR